MMLRRAAASSSMDIHCNRSSSSSTSSRLDTRTDHPSTITRHLAQLQPTPANRPRPLRWSATFRAFWLS
jgi:hypothetical protein